MIAVPAVAIFSEPPGIEAEIGAVAESGDVVLHVRLAGTPFMALVLTTKAAFEFNLMLANKALDAKRQREAGR